MKLLRLAPSDEFISDVDPSTRAVPLVDQILERELGEPVESITRSAVPSARLPGIVESWLERYEPDIVYLLVNIFFLNYESTPQRVRRRGGKRIGAPVADAGIRMGKIPRLNKNPAFKASRRLIKKVVGGDTYFEPAEYSTNVISTLQKVIQREGTGAVVFGPVTAQVTREWMKPTKAEARRLLVHRDIQSFCVRTSVPYYGADIPITAADYFDDMIGDDDLHSNQAGHAMRAVVEARMILGSWRRLHGLPLDDLDGRFAAWCIDTSLPIHAMVTAGQIHDALDRWQRAKASFTAAGGPEM